MKDTKFNITLMGWAKKLLLSLIFILGVGSSYAGIGYDVRWYYQNEGQSIKVSAAGNYIVIDAVGFNGEIFLNGIDIQSADGENLVNNLKVAVGDKKFYTSGGNVTDKFYAYFDEETGKLSLVNSSAAGIIAAEKKSVCRGEYTKLSLVDVSLSDYTVKWGVYSLQTKDTTWISSYDNMLSIQYMMDTINTVGFVSKITSKTDGETLIHTLPISPTLASCGYTVTTNTNTICLSESVEVSTSYTAGKSYQWRDDRGNVYATTTTPSATIKPKSSGTVALTVYADGLYVGQKEITVRSMKECGYSVSAKRGYVCLGRSDLLTTDFVASSYKWTDSKGQVIDITSEPSCRVKPIVNTTYMVFADNDFYIGEASVSVMECTFFIASRYPIASCLQDTNYLMASGTAMLEDIDKNVFQWESSYDGVNWKTLPTQSYRLSVVADTSMYYRVIYDGITEQLYYPKPDCNSIQYCDGLETKTLFYETFGFFMTDDVYVRGDKIYQSEIEVDHTTSVKLDKSGDSFTSGDFDLDGDYFKARSSEGDVMTVDVTSPNKMSIHNYVAPDPNGCVVTATKFINPDGNGANQFVGTNGHLYLTENPMLSQYVKDTWCKDGSLRLQDGYYAIVCSPDSCDHNKNHKDFIACSDYTGNKNGAMLFVNAGQTNDSRAAIYAQKASLSCPADRFNFGMSVRNATNIDSTESKNPVNLTICLLKEFNDDAKVLPSNGDPNVLARITTGDVKAGNDWSRIDEFIQLADKTQFIWVVIYNDGQSGDGNDMLLDDITFSVCIPKANLVAKMNGQTFTREVVSCSGEPVTLEATQESAYISDPIYLFQYQKIDSTKVPFDTTWVDVREYSAGSPALKENTVDILTNQPQYWGTVDYRVIIADDYENARKVADGKEKEVSECEFTFHIATTKISIRNTYGGEMAPRDSVAFCNIIGTKVLVLGERLLTLKNHPWTMSWWAADGSLIYKEEVVGVSKDTLTLEVIPGNIFSVYHSGKFITGFSFARMDSVVFKAEDEGGCEFFQTIKLHPKMNLDLKQSVESIVDCNSATLKVSRNYTEPSLVFDWSSVPGTATAIDDTTQTFVPANLENYSQIAGTVTVYPVNVDDKYCFLQESITVPYTIQNGHYKMKITSSKDPVCVSTDSESSDVVVLSLTAKVDATTMGEEEAAKIDARIKQYNWHITFSDASVLDTITTTNVLSFTNKDLLSADGSQIKADKLSASIVSTNTDVCETITHPLAESEMNIEIREGGFTLKVSAPESVCLLSEQSQELKITITPATALLNITSLTLMYNGEQLTELTELDGNFTYKLDATTYPEIFTAGNTGNFHVHVYDETCKTNNESNEATVKYNGYDWKFNSPDSCLTQSSNLFNIIATIDSAKAVNHIQSYNWTLNGVPFVNNGFTYAYPVSNSMSTLFELTTSDGICPDVTHSLATNVSINYTISLSSAVDKICSTESAKVHATITPASSANFIKTYKWYAKDSMGVETLIKLGTTQDTVLTLSAAEYPSLFQAGNKFTIHVVADDEICSTVVSDNALPFDVNMPFTISMKASHEKVCYTPEKEVKLNVTVTPANAANHITSYKWTRTSAAGVLTQTTTSQEAVISAFEGWMDASDDVQFTVEAYDDICVSSSAPVSDKVTMDINTPYTVTLTTDKKFACSQNDQIFLTGTNSGSANANVHYTYEFTSTTSAGGTKVLPNTLNQRYVTDYTSNYNGLKPANNIVYQFVVNDGDVCGPNASDPVAVVVQTPFVATAYISDPTICKGETSVASLVTFEPKEAAAFIKMYNWHEVGVGTVGNPLQDYVYTATTAGQHSFYAKISDGICYGTDQFPVLQSNTVHVQVNTPMAVSLAQSANTYCSDKSTDPITLTATTTSGEPLVYSLYYGSNVLYESVLSHEKAHSWIVEPTDDMNKFIVVVDDGVCPSARSYETATVDVHHPIDFAVTIPAEDYRICLGQSVHFSTQVLAGQQNLTYLWQGLSRDEANEGIRMDSLYVVDTPIKEGTYGYSITATDGVCPEVTHEVSPIEVLLTPYVEITSSKEKLVIGSTVDFTANVMQGEPTIYYWMMDTVALAATPENYLQGVTPPASAVYTVYVTNGICPTTSSSIEVGVLIPTAFTPHHKDGLNDVWMKGFDVVIFDRYGMKVFEGSDGWNGQKGAVMADPGVYFCTVVLKTGELYKGTIEVVKID